MSNFFNADNKVFAGLGKIIDCIILNALWLFTSIPIFTIGASTTAFYYTMNKVIQNGHGYVSQEYFGAFKREFKQSTLIWLILIVIYALLGFDYYIMFQFSKAGKGYGALGIAFLFMMAFVTMWVIYIFPYLARFENSTKDVLKNAAAIALANLLKTILLFILLVASGVIIYLLPIGIMFMPAAYTLSCVFILEKVFKKYMSPEQIAAEEEKNREFF